MFTTALQKKGKKLKVIKIYVIHSKVPNTFPFQISEVQMRKHRSNKIALKPEKNLKSSLNVFIKDLDIICNACKIIYPSAVTNH